MKASFKTILIMIILVLNILNPVFGMDYEDYTNLNLDGKWEFYEGVLLYPSDFDLGDIPEESVISLPRDMMAGDVLNPTGLSTYGTIRKKFHLYDDYVGEILAFKNGLFRENCKIWINSELIIDSGKIATNKVDALFVNPTTFGNFKSDDANIEVVIQFSKFNFYNFTDSVLSIDTIDSITKARTLDLGLDLFLLGAIIALFIYHLIFYFRSKMFGNDTGALYFSLLFLMMALRIINTGDYFIAHIISRVPFELINKLGFWSFYLLLPLFVLFINEIFNNFYDRRYIKLNKNIAFILAFLVLVLDYEWYSQLMLPYIIYLIGTIAYNLKNHITNHTENRLMLLVSSLGFMIATLAFINDLFYMMNIYVNRLFSVGGTIVFLAVISVLISNKFNRVFTRAEYLADENKKYVSEIEEINQNLEQTIDKRTEELTEAISMLEVYSNEMRKLLDNVKQGFLTIDDSFMIKGEYSKECIKIFGEDLRNKRISDELFKYNLEQKLFFETIVQKIFSGNDYPQSELFLSLLPTETTINGRLFSMDYKLITSKNIESNLMLILTDITETKELEEHMNSERNLLNMIVNAVIHYDDFIKSIEDYLNFSKVEMVSILKSDSEFEDKVFKILKEVHTYKGIFHRFNMLNTVELLHSLETEVFEIKDNLESFDEDSLLVLLNQYAIEKYIDEDLATIKQKLGEDFLSERNYLKIHKKEMVRLLNILRDSGCSNKAIDEFRKLRLVPFKKLLKIYPDVIKELSVKMGKNIAPMEIVGGNFSVEADKYDELIRCISHLYRNCVSHGIEFEDERESKNKDPMGTIKTIIEESGNSMAIIIEDDGAGISISEVKNKLIRKYNYDVNDLRSLSDNQVIELLFNEGVSLSDTESYVSGRGIGLSAVKSAVENLGGNIKVETDMDKFTRFIIRVPKYSLSYEFKIEIDDIFRAIVKSIRDMVAKYMGYGAVSDMDAGFEKVDGAMVSMNTYTSMIEFNGDIRGKLAFTFDDGAIGFIKKVMGVDTDDNDRDTINDSIAELTNIILGNSSSSINSVGTSMIVGMPYVIKHADDFDLSRYNVFKYEVKYGEFDIKVYLIVD